MEHTSTVVKQIVLDAFYNDAHPLIGLVDYLINDKGYSVERLLKFAVRTLKLDENVCINTLDVCGISRLH